MVEEITDLVVLPERRALVGQSRAGNIIVLSEGAKAELDRVNVWIPYTPRLWTIVSEKQFNEKFERLREEVFEKKINLLYYHNINSTSFWAYIANGAQFLYFRDKIAEDVQQDILPFNYHTSLAVSIEDRKSVV